MLTLIDLDQLPEEYGGTFKPGDGKEEACRWFSPEEIGFRKFVYVGLTFRTPYTASNPNTR